MKTAQVATAQTAGIRQQPEATARLQARLNVNLDAKPDMFGLILSASRLYLTGVLNPLISRQMVGYLSKATLLGCVLTAAVLFLVDPAICRLQKKAVTQCVPTFKVKHQQKQIFL
jgi:hypothetical protein